MGGSPRGQIGLDKIRSCIQLRRIGSVKRGGQGTNRCRDKSSGWCHGFSFLSTYTRQESSCHGLLSAYRKVLYFIPSICRRQRAKYDERL